MTNGLYLIYEALSRARTRQPQDTPSEAYLRGLFSPALVSTGELGGRGRLNSPRPARQIAMRARQEQNHRLGG